jgi:membrane protein
MKFKYKRYFFILRPARIFIQWSKKIKFNKYNNASLYSIGKIFFNNLGKHEILERANAVTFNFTLAIFPAIIFLFTLLPYVSSFIPQVNPESIMGLLGEIMPDSMYEVISHTVEDMISNTRGSLLTFGFLFSLYLSTNGMMALMTAFNAIYMTRENRSSIKMRFTAVALTFILAFVLVLAIVLLVVGQFVLYWLNDIEWLRLDDYLVTLLLISRFLVIFIVFFLAIAFIYYLGPAVHYNWSFFSWGSVIATLLCLAISYGFSYYITSFGTYNKIYGSIGALIALMIWQQLLTIVLLFGYEINASIHEATTRAAMSRLRKAGA